MNKFTIDHYINKFEAIPEYRWYTGKFIDNTGTMCCALGHCGRRNNTYSTLIPSRDYEANQLDVLLNDDVACINDGEGRYKELGTSPKERILNALYLIKSGIIESKDLY